MRRGTAQTVRTAGGSVVAGWIVSLAWAGAILAALLLGCSGRSASEAEESAGRSVVDDPYRTLRHRMVETQLAARGISDERLLDAMARVPRHLFIPPSRRAAAYGDFPVSIGEGQTISQPYIVALMTQYLALEGPERVLEIGTGSGYQAAVLAELASEVYTIEIIPELARRARLVLSELGYENVRVRTGDGYQGWDEHAPFDAIIITAAPPYVPQPLLEQLAEGGRLVVPLGEEGEIQTLTLIERIEGRLLERALCPVRFVPMTGEIEGGEPD